MQVNQQQQQQYEAALIVREHEQQHLPAIMAVDVGRASLLIIVSIKMMLLLIMI
jgi:hypothetical protein